MSYPKYFSYFPNNKYTLTINKAGHPQFFGIKDFFHMMKVGDDILREDTLYYTHNVTNGKRPEQISYEVYGDEQYYWILLQINGIVDYYNEWSLSFNELQEFIVKKYGSWSASQGIHHYETLETTDEEGNVLLPAGLVVGEDYEFRYEYDGVERYSRPIPITNFLYEERLNRKKSEIFILQKKYIPDYVREIRNYGEKLEPLESSVNISDYFR